MPELARSPTHQTIERFAALAVGLIVFAGLALSLIRTFGKSNDFQDLDFGAIYRGAIAVRSGESPYVVDRHGPLGSYVYGPALAYAAMPLTCLDYIWACRLWTALNWTFAVGCVIIAAYLASGPNWTWSVALLTAVATGSYFWSAIRVGQLAMMMAGAYFAWAYCLRTGRSFVGGLCLAWAAGLKLAPGFLIPYLIVRRDGRALSGVASGGLVLLLMPMPWIGIDGSIRLHREWIEHCRNTQIEEQTYRPENQALLGTLARLPAISDGHTAYDANRLTALGRTYPSVMLLVAAVLYSAIALECRRTNGSIDRDAETCHLAILIVCMTLLHPRAWTCNFVSLAIPAAMLATMAIRRTSYWPIAVSGLALLAVTCALPKIGPGNQWSWWRWGLQSKDFWAAIIVVTICGICLRKRIVASPAVCLANAA